MPTALATTKRKFHKILDSISNASSPSLKLSDKSGSTTTLPANFAPPSKRLRVERPKSEYIPQVRPATSVRPVSLPPQSADSASESGKATDAAPPYFNPWDRTQFLERLKSFRHVDKWLGKPDKINEVQWAKRGWVCVGKETVRCRGGCEASVVVKLEDDPRPQDDKKEEEADTSGEQAEEEDWREEARKALVEHYAGQISKGHKESCLWRRRGCDDTIQRLPLLHPSTALDGMRQRYDALVKISNTLPPEAVLSVPEALNLDSLSADLLSVLKHQDTSPNETSDPTIHQSSRALSKPAIVLALLGWHPDSGHLPGLVTCSACFRRLGLWLFTPPATTDDARWAESSALSKLDVIGEHREYCPWTNAVSQSGGGRRTSFDNVAGWEILFKAIRSQANRIRADAEDEREDVADDQKSEVVSLTIEEERALDKERESKLKRLKQVFSVKRKKEG